MIGTSFLKRTLEDSLVLETAAQHLRDAGTVHALVDAWFAHCDKLPEGVVLDALRDTYTECLARFVPLARAG